MTSELREIGLTVTETFVRLIVPERGVLKVALVDTTTITPKSQNR